MQRELDEQMRSDTRMKKLSLQKMLPAEVIIKKLEEDGDDPEIENTEANKEIENTKNGEPEGNDEQEEIAAPQAVKVELSSSYNNTHIYGNTNYLTRTSKLLNSFKNIEKACRKIKSLYSQQYDVEFNVGIGSFGFDAVAISKNSNEDIIFEIKNYKNLAAFSINSVYTLLYEKEKYEEMNGRKCRLVYIFVSPRENIERYKPIKTAVFSENNIEVEYWAEEDL